MKPLHFPSIRVRIILSIVIVSGAALAVSAFFVSPDRHSLVAAVLAAAALALPAGLLVSGLAVGKLAAMTRMADEMGRGELGRRIAVAGDDEADRLARTVNLLAERLEDKLVRLTRDRALLVAVLDAVGEGLAFVDERDILIASNGAFRLLVGASQPPDGQPLSAVLPQPALRDAVRTVLTSGKAGRATIQLSEPDREVGFRILRTTLANQGAVALLITDDVSQSPRVEALRLETASILARSLGSPILQLPRETVLALELSRAAEMLDEPKPAPEVVMMGQLLPRVRGAEQAPPVFVVRSRVVTAFRLVRLKLGLRADDQEDVLPATIEVEALRVVIVIDTSAGRGQDWALPRSSESLGARLRALARRLALAHLDSAGAEFEEPGKKLVIGMPRA